jgi:glyoxylase-like metal-dependent hydrolase (beta-lactamase superfamily II)
MTFSFIPSPLSSRRRFLGMAMGTVLALPMARPAFSLGRDEEVIPGPPVPDLPLEQVSDHVWMLFAKDGFPTPENQGMMCNIAFVITKKGVVAIDPGGSLQIGEMAIRQLKKHTALPVTAVFVSHYHGDHWLGNHAFVKEYGDELPIYALAQTRTAIEGTQGTLWLGLMAQWTQQATAGTRIVPPNRTVTHGHVFDFGDVHLKTHFYGRAHTEADLCIEVVEDRLTHVGDVAMDRRIANMDDGSYPGTFSYLDALEKEAKSQIWLPGHGRPGSTVLAWQRDLFEGIYEPCVAAVQAGEPESVARKRVLEDPRVATKAAHTQGFESNIGKYISLAYLEAERAHF